MSADISLSGAESSGVSAISVDQRGMKAHWSANMYPIHQEDLDSIARDIKANGQRIPIKQLMDGQIVDGRTRWLACKKAGVEPIIEIINPDGREVTDEEIFSLVTSCNSMRYSMNASQRACCAAQAWKKLYPDGNAPGQGRKQKGKIVVNSIPSETKPGIAVNFQQFAKDRFNVSPSYANQALALLNDSPELCEQAKEIGIESAYATFQERKKKRDADKINMRIIQKHPDLSARMADGKLSFADALTLAIDRHRQKIEQAEVKRKHHQEVAEGFATLLEWGAGLEGLESDEIYRIIENNSPRSEDAETEARISQQLSAVIAILTEIQRRKETE
jgi:hypothetical protein